jgi:hypothetical protein
MLHGAVKGGPRQNTHATKRKAHSQLESDHPPRPLSSSRTSDIEYLVQNNLPQGLNVVTNEHALTIRSVVLPKRGPGLSAFARVETLHARSSRSTHIMIEWYPLVKRMGLGPRRHELTGTLPRPACNIDYRITRRYSITIAVSARHVSHLLSTRSRIYHDAIAPMLKLSSFLFWPCLNEVRV